MATPPREAQRPGREGGRREQRGSEHGSGLPSHIPPQNLEAEEAVLGAMLLNPQVFDIVQEVGLRENDFYSPNHRRIFRAIMSLAEKDAVDALTVIDALKQSGDIEEIGGPVTVLSLVDNVPAVANARHYAQIVRDQATLRQLIDTGIGISKLGYEHPDEPARLVDQAEQMVFDMSHQRQAKDFIYAADLLPEIYDELATRAESGAPSGLSSGFRDFDTLTGGFHKQALVIVGARASMGKTSWALNVAEYMALKEKKPVAIFSLEMGAKELIVRMLCSVAKVDMHRIRVSKPHDDDWPRLVDAVGQISEARQRLFVDDTAFLTPMELRSKARRMHAKYDLGCILIDYLQLMDPGRRIDNRQEQIAYISRSLKALAKDLDIPIVALSQLSRGLEQRNDKRPMLSDLRESGAIEQDADMVVFIHRPEYYDRDNPDLKGRAEIIVAKNRNGRTGHVEVAFLDKYTKFVDLARPHHAASAPAPTSGPPAPASGPPPPASPGDEDGVW